ncbi:MAG: hypothetical protein M2R45_00145 [Verrucomicrobia subdivision 3 bacterium]|nr:hypothetical protein [Limisphaerales bacterium]MCS1412395.1 hypothetical protein [Limisphaerales bacterium]
MVGENCRQTRKASAGKIIFAHSFQTPAAEQDLLHFLGRESGCYRHLFCIGFRRAVGDCILRNSSRS